MAELTEHPKLLELKSYGIENHDQINLAFLVLVDLSEVKGWWNVQTHPCKELDMAFVSGQANRSSAMEVILPIPSDMSLSAEDIQQFLLRTVDLEDHQKAGLILAVHDTDSTVVYYKVSDGLVPPESPEMSEIKKQKRTKQFQSRRRHIAIETNKYVEKKRLQLQEDYSNA